MKVRSVMQEFDWKGWLGWMMTTMLGVQFIALVLFLADRLNLHDQWWGELTIVSLAGISMGVCQWIWIRTRLVSGGWWILCTLSGWYLVCIVGILWAYSNATGILSRLIDFVALLAIPAMFSLPQWFLLRRQFRGAAWWWIVARPLAWLAGVGLMALAGWLNILSVDIFDLTFVSLSVAAAIFGLGFSAVTGAAFVWIQMKQAAPAAKANNIG